MNSLSWMIYLADVADSVSNTLAIVTVASVIGCVSSIIGFAASHDRVWAEEPKKSLRNAALWFGGMVIVARLLAAPIPTSATIYAIAASEMGEQVIKTPTGGKAIKALDAWLDRQIAGKPEPKE